MVTSKEGQQQGWYTCYLRCGRGIALIPPVEADAVALVVVLPLLAVGPL